MTESITPREQEIRNLQPWYDCTRSDAGYLLRLLDAERARVARMLDLGRYWNGPGHGPGRWDSSHAIELRAAAEGTLDWSRWEKTWHGAAQERGLCSASPHKGPCHYSHLLGDG